MIFSFFSRKPPVQAQVLQETIENNASDLQDQAELHPPASLSPSPSPSTEPQSAKLSDPSSLYSLIRSIPPQTFHTYSLDRLREGLADPPSPTILTALSSFFSSLVPPPRLHCVRCHKSYFEVENTDRSCLVPHDDDSAEVECVPLSTGKAKGIASEYESHWGCCGRTVEGDGDMGPPDGWCYEGKHTTDIKRARFRADSTPSDDKLVSCARLRCHAQLLSPSPSSVRSSTRKRARPVEFDETEAEASHTDGDRDPNSPKRRKTKRSASRRRSGTSVPAEAKELKEEDGDRKEDREDSMQVDPLVAEDTTAGLKPKTKRTRKQPKSAAFVTSDVEYESSNPSPPSVQTGKRRASGPASTSTLPNPSPAGIPTPSQQGQDQGQEPELAPLAAPDATTTADHAEDVAQPRKSRRARKLPEQPDGNDSSNSSPPSVRTCSRKVEFKAPATSASNLIPTAESTVARGSVIFSSAQEVNGDEWEQEKLDLSSLKPLALLKSKRSIPSLLRGSDLEPTTSPSKKPSAPASRVHMEKQPVDPRTSRRLRRNREKAVTDTDKETDLDTDLDREDKHEYAKRSRAARSLSGRIGRTRAKALSEVVETSVDAEKAA